MSNILTPLSLWKNFDDSLDTAAEVISEKSAEGIKTQYLNFYGRDTGAGRVKIYAVFAENENVPPDSVVLLIPDSSGTVDEELMKFFVRQGYAVLMPDYRGEWVRTNNYTVYPANVEYANLAKCGRHKDFVDEDAYKTCWYEWVAVARYCCRYLKSRGFQRIGAVGIRDGGEIGWKLAAGADLGCLVTVCSAGWQSYRGYFKFGANEPAFDDERYRFMAAIDSQAYAPFVKCPVLMLCSTNDESFDYDRAYDTFSRINEKFVGDSVISYSVHCNGCIDLGGTKDMFLFLDKFIRARQVFLPKPAVITVTADSEQNLIAHCEYDPQGVPEEFGVFMAEDCIDPAVREWSPAPCKGGEEQSRDFYLNVYEKAASVFALCYARYTNGFTVWSRMAVKKISGKFKNMSKRCRVMYSSKNGTDSLSIGDRSCAIGRAFLTSSVLLPQVVEECGLKGAYSPCGLMTFRTNVPRFAPEPDAVLKLDIYCENDSEVTFRMQDMESGTIYYASARAAGGIWQSVLLESKDFKSEQGIHISGFGGKLKFTIACAGRYAVNNLMWL